MSAQRRVLDCVLIDRPKGAITSPTIASVQEPPIPFEYPPPNSNGQGRKPKPFPRLEPRTTNSVKAGLTFPVGRVQRYIRKASEKKVGITAAVYLAAVLEYLTTELVEVAGDQAEQRHKKKIIPRDIKHAIERDEEFSILLADVVIREGGGVNGQFNNTLFSWKDAIQELDD